MQAGPLVSSTLSPSFNSYSSSGTENLADIAARVVNEFRRENGSNDDVFGFDEYVHHEPWDVIDKDHYDYDDNQSSNHHNRSLLLKDQDQDQDHDDHDEDEDEDEESEFEFAFVSAEPDSSPISADEIFHNGLIKPVYPLFDRALLLEAPSNDAATKKESDKTTRRTRQPLRKLMVEEERETATTATSSCDSSESDELEGLMQGSFCVWKPKNGAVSGGGGNDGRRGRGKKSGSTGSSKRWKLRDILSRSGSVGKDGFVFVAPIKKLGGSKRAGKVEAVEEKKEKNDVVLSSNNDDERGGGGDMLNGRNKDNTTTTTEDKKRSFLPYKQDFVGFLANVNGLSRNLHPF